MINQVVLLNTEGDVIYQAADVEFAEQEAERLSNTMAYTTFRNYVIDAESSTLEIDRRMYARGVEVSKEVTTIKGHELEAIVALLANSGLLPKE